MADSQRLYESRKTRDPGHEQWWAAHGYIADATSRSVPRCCMHVPAAGYAAVPELHGRTMVGFRIRFGRRCRAIQISAEIFALPECSSWNEISGSPFHHRRWRHASRSTARAQDGGASAGRCGERTRQTDPDSLRHEVRTFRRASGWAADRGASEYPELLFLAAGHEVGRICWGSTGRPPVDRFP